MKQGGIFNGRDALGLNGLSGTSTSCTPDNPSMVKRVQEYLKSHGAPNIHVDGVWQGCTASAWNKVVGHPQVTCTDLRNMGIDCSSDDCQMFTDLVVPFTLAAISQCTDGSDGVGTGQGACPSGQTWSDILKACIPDLTGGSTPKPSTQSGACPSGQTNVPLVGCVTVPGMGGQTQGQNCPSGSVLTPAGCASTTTPGQITTPTKCPEGQFDVPLLGCMGTPLAKLPGTDTSKTCPAGQTNVPLLGCMAVPGISGGKGGGAPTDIFGGLMTTITGLLGGGGVTCPAGSVADGKGGCIGSNGYVAPVAPGTPGSIAPAVPNSPFGGMGTVIVGVLAVGVAATGYWYYKKHQQETALEFGDPSLFDDGMGGMGMYDMGMYDPVYAYPNRRKGKKSRRRNRKGRRGCRG